MIRHVLILMEGLPYPVDPRVRAQAAALRDGGYDVTVVCPTGLGHDERDVTLDGVRVRRYAAPPAGEGPLGYVREYAAAFMRIRKIACAVGREHAVDVVLVCAPPDFLVAAARPLARRGAAIVFDYREISPELFEVKFGRRGLPHRVLLRAERYAFRHADAVTTVSEPCAELARTRGGVEPERVFLVGNGPDPARVYEVPARPELRRGRRHLVLWLGVMSVQEGMTHLVDAADHIVNGQGRDDVQFAIVGPGDVREALVGEVARRGLADYVELPGLVGDDLVRAYMSTADVCVGVDEPNVMNDRAAMRKILEYLALGRAVVQFPLAEMQRLCGDATVYARSGDADDLAAQICGLLDDPDRRVALGEAARRRMWSDGQMWPQQAPVLLAAAEAAIARAKTCTESRLLARDTASQSGYNAYGPWQAPTSPRPPRGAQS